ncbi:MAG: flavodoxin family protein [Eggerthellaceae bacterium]|nr:flavodoxin family protein [Eggerthellaceae bacterium]
MKNRLIISASPRRQGRCSQLVERLAVRFRMQDESAHVSTFFLPEHTIAPCDACDWCRDEPRCVIDDDMRALYAVLDEADEVVVVAPVYFAGPPAQYKALLDRLQAYYHTYLANKAASVQKEKRTLRLFVIGDGLDPHGFEPLVVCTRSAFAIAGFCLEDVYSGVGLDRKDFDTFVACPEAYRWKNPSAYQGERCKENHGG